MQKQPDYNEEVLEPDSEESVLHPLEKERKIDKYMKHVVTVAFIILFILGVGTGYVLAQKNLTGSTTEKSSEIIQTEKTVGSTDSKTFKDSAEGKIEKGGIDGEGTHKLIRTGGPSQTVYLTSSVVDLDQFVGKNVKVWGETFAADKAGWLMDVGKVELK